MVLAATGIFGTLIGSFLNVVIYRVPLGRSIVSPASACGTCGHEVRPYDNVPILSWLVLHGHCRDCGAPIPPRYLIIEVLVGIFFAVVAAVFIPPVLAGPDVAAGISAALAFLAFLYLAAISVALAAIDLDHQRLPNAIVLPAYPVGGVLLSAASLLADDPGALLRAFISAAAMGIVYLMLALVSRGMGMGDVKLAGVLGLFLGWLGWEHLAVGWIAGFLIGGLVGVGVLLSHRGTLKTAIPFGPWMLAGAWLGILLGPLVAGSYLSFVHSITAGGS